MDVTASVSLSNVSKSFGRRMVLVDVSLSVAAGEAVCICGANAAGKTTLLKTVVGLLRPNGGSIKICGFDVFKEPERIKPLIGFISHRPMVYPRLTVEENMRFFAALYNIKDPSGCMERLLAQCGLAGYRHERAGLLSAGMVQRLAVARAMIHNPRVLLADEAFAGLDGEAADQLTVLMRRFTEAGGAVLLTGHRINRSLQCSSRVAVLADGRIIFDRDVSQIEPHSFASDYLSYAEGKS